VTEFSKTFPVFFKWPDLTDVQVMLTGTVSTISITIKWASIFYAHVLRFQLLISAHKTDQQQSIVPGTAAVVGTPCSSVTAAGTMVSAMVHGMFKSGCTAVELYCKLEI
jgi:hypothetical protein